MGFLLSILSHSFNELQVNALRDARPANALMIPIIVRSAAAATHCSTMADGMSVKRNTINYAMVVMRAARACWPGSAV